DDTTWDRGGPRAVDSHVWDDTDGEMYMTFGSWDPVGQDVIAIAELDPVTGRIDGFDPDKPAYYPDGGHPSLHTVATFGEAAYSLHHGEYYYLFINLGSCCSGLDSTYTIIVGRSTSIFGPYVDRDGRSFNISYPEDSYPGTVVASGRLGEGRRIGPGHTGLIERDGGLCLSYHFYDGDDNGHPKLGMAPLAFDEAGWPYAVTDQTCHFR
ncbi:MAG: family 43 glycosylhydrolase, partial [Myxococcota bacterium]